MTATYTFVTTAPTPVGAAKHRLFIGTTATSPTNDTFTEVADVEQLPDFGAAASPVKTQTLNSGEITSKGVQTFGGGDIILVKRAGDAGQTALIAAGQDFSGLNYNLRIIGPDKVASTGTGTIYDIKALIMGTPTQIGTANNVLKLKITAGFNSDVVTTAAT